MDHFIAIPIILGGLSIIFMIVVVLALHQQKMTKLLNPGAPNDVNTIDQVASLRAEVAKLHDLLMNQAMAIENLSDKIGTLRSGAPPRIEDRFKEQSERVSTRAGVD